MPSKSKKVAQPPIKSPRPDPDPVGFAQVLAEISAQLEEAYQERLRAFLRVFHLVKFAPAVRQRIRAAETASGGPTTFLVALTVHRRDASGFPRLVGKLATPLDGRPPAEPPKAAEDGAYMTEWNPDFETSSLSRTVTRDGTTAKVSIVRMVGTTNWFMAVTDAANEKDEAEPIWEHPFATDKEAYAEFEQTVAEEGMHSLLYGWKSIPLLQRRDKEPNLDFVTSSLSRTVTRERNHSQGQYHPDSGRNGVVAGSLRPPRQAHDN